MPRVSLGMPVYNGENYIREALDAVLAQTYEDFELIICDNASTDRTQQICAAYAAQDRRIRYCRQHHNVGAAGNFNKTFELATGAYFKWLAHDDTMSANVLEQCVAVLDGDRSVILAYPRTVSIGPQGQMLHTREERFYVMSKVPWRRFGQLCLRMLKCYPVFGLIRSKYLGQTRLIDRFPHSDKILLLELGLLGKFQEVPDAIFYRRFHAHNSTLENTTPLERMRWFDTSYAGTLRHEYYRVLAEKCRVVQRFAPSLLDTLLCYAFITLWAGKQALYEMLVKCGLKKSWVTREKEQVAM